VGKARRQRRREERAPEQKAAAYSTPAGDPCKVCAEATKRLDLPGHGTWDVCTGGQHRTKL
jgi:hypothetical protein